VEEDWVYFASYRQERGLVLFTSIVILTFIEM